MNFKTAAGLCTFTIASLTTSTLALAHPGHGSHSVHESHSFMSGLTHPVTGMDHLIMLIAFGLLIGALSFSTKIKSSSDWRWISVFNGRAYRRPSLRFLCDC